MGEEKEGTDEDAAVELAIILPPGASDAGSCSCPVVSKYAPERHVAWVFVLITLLVG